MEMTPKRVRLFLWNRLSGKSSPQERQICVSSIVAPFRVGPPSWEPFASWAERAAFLHYGDEETSPRPRSLGGAPRPHCSTRSPTYDD